MHNTGNFHGDQTLPYGVTLNVSSNLWPKSQIGFWEFLGLMMTTVFAKDLTIFEEFIAS